MLVIFFITIMNYFRNKKHIMKIILLTLSVIGSTSYINANDRSYFPVGKQIFLDATSIPNWYDDANYPYMYMFGDDENKAWVKMERYTGNEGGKYFTGTVPQTGYYGLIFTCQKVDDTNWDNCKQQTINIIWNSIGNCYTFSGRNSKNKIIGNWRCIDATGDHYFPMGKQIFLDTTNVSNWHNPYM